MKVRELIERLQALPAEIDVVVAGYESGYNDVTALEVIAIQRDVNSEWYFGRHGDAPDGVEGISAVQIK